MVESQEIGLKRMVAVYHGMRIMTSGLINHTMLLIPIQTFLEVTGTTIILDLVIWQIMIINRGRNSGSGDYLTRE